MSDLDQIKEKQIDTINPLSRAYTLIQNDSVKQAEFIIQTYLLNQQSKMDSIQYFDHYIAIGDQYIEKSLFAFSLKYYLEANKISANLSPEYQLVALSKIGLLYYDLKDYDKAHNYFLLNKNIAQEHNLKRQLVSSYINLGEIYRFRDEPNQAMTHYNKGLTILDDNDRSMSKATIFNNIACVYLKIEQFDSAYQYFSKSKELIFQLNDNEKKAAINTSLGNYYYETGNYIEAIKNYINTFDYDIPNEVREDIIFRDAYQGLHLSYLAQKDFKNAYNSYQQYTRLKGKIFNIKKHEELLQIETQLQIEKHTQKIDFLEQLSDEQNKKKNLLTLIFSIISILLVAIILLIYYVYKLKLRTAKQNHEILQNQKELTELEIKKRKADNAKLLAVNKELEASEIIAKLQRRHLRSELEHKKRELASQTIHISSKNQILNQIKENLKKHDFLKKNKQVVDTIIQEINRNINLDEDWKQFKIHFEESHPKFFVRLKENFPDLTYEELKLCAYLRLSLSTKEIAQLLNITPVAVNKRRNRLRKKINIDSEVDLYGFIAKM